VVRRSRVTNSSKDELALFREIYMWKQVYFYLLFISWAVLNTCEKRMKNCRDIYIYSHAKGHDIDQFVSEIEPNLRMYQELMQIDLPFPIQYPIVRA
jgi:hypothetical protein